MSECERANGGAVYVGKEWAVYHAGKVCRFYAVNPELHEDKILRFRF